MSDRPARLDDITWLTEQYVKKQRSAQQIAELLGCTPKVVYGALTRAGIERRDATAPRYPELADPEWLQARYTDETLSTSEIGRRLGCPAKTVRDALIRAGIEMHSRGHRVGRPVPELLHDAGWLTEQYIQHGRDSVDLAQELDVDPTTLRDALDKAGIARRGKDQQPHSQPLLHDRKWLYATYVTAGTSARTIATSLGCNPTSVRDALIRHGIALRSHPGR